MMRRRTILLSSVGVAFLAAVLLAGSLSASKAEADLGRDKSAQVGEIVPADNKEAAAPPQGERPALSTNVAGRGSRLVTLLEEGFEDYQPEISPWPEDWHQYSEVGSAFWAIYGASPYAGENHLGCTDDVVVDNWMVTSMLHVPAEGDTFKFYSRAYYGETETWEVWINADGNTVADFTTSGTMIGSNATSSSTYAQYSYPIPAQYHDADVWISIRCLSEDGYLFCVDNVTMPNLGLFEGFEGVPASGFPPDGWTQEVVSGGDSDNEWQVSDGSSTHPNNVQPYEGSGMAEYDSYYTNPGNSARLISPPLDLSDPELVGAKVAVLMYHDTGYPDDDDRIEIQTSENGSDWDTKKTLSRNDGTTGWHWHEFGFALSSYPSQLYLGITGISEYGNSIYIDNILVRVYADYEMEIADTTGYIGGTVAVDVYGKWDEPMQAYQLGITFDDSKLAFDSLDFSGSITDSYAPFYGPMGDEMSPGFLSIGALWPPTSVPPGLSGYDRERLVRVVFDVIATEETVTELVFEDVSIYTYTDGVNAYEAYPYRASGAVLITEPTAICGDADGNGFVNIADAVSLIGYIFGGGEPPFPLCSGDSDGNGFLNISDAVDLISYIFGGGEPPDITCCNPLWKSSERDGTVSSPAVFESANEVVSDWPESALGILKDYLCGDAYADLIVNVSDAAYILNYVLIGSSPPDPLCSGDASGDGFVGVVDVSYLCNYLFRPGYPEPVDDCCGKW